MTRPVPGTPSWLRETNERTALSLFLEHGRLTRNRLGELSGLSKPTASQIVSRLEWAGIIEAVGEVSGGRGPNAASYAVRSERVLGVAVDIADAVIRSTVVDALGTEHPVVETAMDPADGERSAVADIHTAIDSACAAADLDAEAVRIVAIGLQGSIDPRSDELSFIDTLPGWPRKGVSAKLADALGRDVRIDNDVNLAAIAERAEGAGRGASSFALLWIGEGLGLAVDLAGTVHRGAAGGAGEIGYLPVPAVAAAVDPHAGTLQDLLGGAAIAELAAAEGVAAGSTSELRASLETHPARHAVLAAFASRVVLGIVPVLAILDPATIVLGGPLGTAAGESLARLVSTEIARAGLWKPEVAASAVPQFPVLRGARHVLEREVRQRLLDELGTISQQPDQGSGAHAT
ncbi:MAG TPA: ROK family transcriptional regulator [Lacisediminihabitans sp.]|nr:ROK family transcriptional regulator [Lacisediminihabitans sp.]HXD61646.1 ROK family transcriptional regulator [Lacisediminihabitans sp.]